MLKIFKGKIGTLSICDSRRRTRPNKYKNENKNSEKVKLNIIAAHITSILQEI